MRLGQVVLLFTLVEAAVLRLASSQTAFACEDIGVYHYCSNVTGGQVRYTHYPNLLGHHSLETASNFFHSLKFDQHTFTCSNLVDTFVCSLFFPLCKNSTNGGDVHILHPCRNLCEEIVDDKCAVQFELARQNLEDAIGLVVPRINCSTFPTFFDSAGACIAIDGTFAPPSPSPEPVCSQSCNSGLISTFGSQFGGVSNCTEPCDAGYTVTGVPLEGVFTSPTQKIFFWAWLGVISIVCLVVSLFTCVNWAVTYKVYRYPERPIIYICVCYILIALSYFIHVCVGPSIVCTASLQSGQSGIASGQTATFICAFTFCLRYFFSIASWTWWVIIMFLWFLNAAVRVNRSTIERPIFQVIYHLLALIIPVVFTIAAMATQSYGGNSITRLCEISTQSRGAQISFVLVPQLVAIFVCIVLLLFGHIWMLLCDSHRASTDLKEDKSPQSSLYKERSMYDIIRTDIFGVLFLIHLTVAASINVYQYQAFEKWQQFYLHCSVCRSCSTVEDSKPLIGVFIFKVTVELLMGTVLILWLKPKSIRDGWKKVYFRLVKGQSLPTESTSTSTSTPTELRTPSTPTSPTWSPTSV
uniref:FzdA n=1 Tax=Halisarca dujardinii TaxID=2583056 RepID=A0A8F8FJ21_HALDU|nr:frizzled A HduFzdA [Halisarca dujardinii]